MWIQIRFPTLRYSFVDGVLSNAAVCLWSRLCGPQCKHISQGNTVRSHAPVVAVWIKPVRMVQALYIMRPSRRSHLVQSLDRPDFVPTISLKVTVYTSRVAGHATTEASDSEHNKSVRWRHHSLAIDWYCSIKTAASHNKASFLCYQTKERLHLSGLVRCVIA